ncbi:MAG: XdhC family protein [Candidatus Hodarchaeota archaeon]
MKELFAQMLSLAEKGRPFVLVTVIRAFGSTPRKIGAKMLVNAEGDLLWGTIGGGAIEKQILSIVPEVIADGEARVLTYSLSDRTKDEAINTGMICGGEMDVFIEPFNVQDQLIIIGAGHIAQALSPIGKQLNFRTIIVDDREDFATQDRFPEADEIVQGSLPQKLEEISFSKRSFIVIITYSHELDEKVLRSCLMKPWRYLGMIASQRKAAEIHERLAKDGFPKDLLKRVRSPIGLPKKVLPVETPQEIAVSIAAELIQEKKQE